MSVLFLLATAAAVSGASTLGALSSTITSAPSATATAAAVTVSGTSPLPLTDYKYTYPNLPQQVNPFPIGRGPQSGYNICNNGTVGPNSQCQTLIVNDITDFCLWGSPSNISSPSTIGDVEAAVVAYCTKNTHGTRLIPAGALTAVQFMRTSAYIQVVGHIDQTVLGLTATDTGGELDPHGADLAGNPLGGLVYSTSLPTGNNSTYMQAISWNNFVGGNQFCIKLCDPTITSPDYCQNIFDLIGCNYNMPSSFYATSANTFESCEGALQDVVGTYTGADGKTSVWPQPSSLPATSVLPWTPRIPASSNCVTYQSTAIYSVAPTTSAAASAATATGAGASGASARPSSSGGSAAASSGAGSGSASAAKPTTTAASGAGALKAGSVGLLALLAAMLV